MVPRSGLPTSLARPSGLDDRSATRITSDGSVRVRCQARVRRTEIKEVDRIGVAAEIELYQFLREDKNTSRASNSKGQEAETKRPSAERVTVKRATKWGSLCERVVKLQDGESIVLDCDGNAAEAHKVRNGLNGITACDLAARPPQRSRKSDRAPGTHGRFHPHYHGRGGLETAKAVTVEILE